MNDTPQSSPDPGFVSATVLLVDDDLAILEGVADLLSIYGYDVMTATNGQEALSAMQKSKPDIVVSDIMMPDMDGYEFFQAVRSNPTWTPIPFIFLTARGQDKDVRLGNRLGADAYLIKPFEPEDLIIMIQGKLKRVRDIQQITQMDISRMKQQLITIFSHELRTPLTYIYGYVHLLQGQVAELQPQEVEDMLDGVRRGADRLISLVEDLMLLVRIDSGVIGMEIALRREETDLSELLLKIVRQYEPLAAQGNVTLHLDTSDQMFLPCMDVYVENALARLVNNGIKFNNRTGGDVWIMARQMEREAVITIKDNGIGMELDKVEQAFERFSQLERETREQQGVGLGLPIANMLIEMHGGQINVLSNPGDGTTFEVRLPLDFVPLPIENGSAPELM